MRAPPVARLLKQTALMPVFEFREVALSPLLPLQKVEQNQHQNEGSFGEQVTLVYVFQKALS